jgi:hypothetical protein
VAHLPVADDAGELRERGIAFCTAAEAATSACRTMAPTVTEPHRADSALRSLMAARSMRSLGEDRRSFIACTRLCPPAR